MSTQDSQPPQFLQVNVRFLQAILEYLKTKPYEEVYQFIQVLTQPVGQPKENTTPTSLEKVEFTDPLKSNLGE